MKTPRSLFNFGKIHQDNVIGSFVAVKFPGLYANEVLAKVDTGAYSGSMHATNIKEISGPGGKKLLAFNPFGHAKSRIKVEAYHVRKVRSSNGLQARRFAIETEVELNGTIYPITITLADRSSMKYKMLVGRNFLKSHGFLVDLRLEDQ